MKKKTTSADLIIATDAMFVKTEDKSTVTMNHFFIALEEKFEFKMTKQWKGIVRDRLKVLISDKVVTPSCDANTTDDVDTSDNNQNSEEEELEQDDADDQEASVAVLSLSLSLLHHYSKSRHNQQQQQIEKEDWR